jgi:hypothetical protein
MVVTNELKEAAPVIAPVALNTLGVNVFTAPSVPAQLGGAGVSQTDPLQQAAQGWALCGLGTAEALHRRGSRGLPVPAIQDGELGSLI